MKRTASILAVIIVLLFSMLIVVQFARLAEANFSHIPLPVVWIASPENGKTYTSAYVPLIYTFSASEGYGVIFQGQPNFTYSLDGKENVSCASSTTLYGLNYGLHTLIVYASITSRGHVAPDSNSPFAIVVISSQTVVFTLKPSILSIEQNKTYNTANIPLAFDMPESASISYSLDEQPNRTISGNSTLKGLTDGTHNIIVYAMDTIGNIVSSDSFYFTIDTTFPRISVQSPENKTYDTAYNATDVPLNFTVSESVSQIIYSLDGQDNVTVAGNATLTGLLDGEHNITVYATDIAGNIGASETIYFSVTAPFPTILVAASALSLTLAGAGLAFYFKKRNHFTPKQTS